MATGAGWQKYGFFKKETTWGTAVTTDIWLPFDDYSVVVTPEFYQASTFTGVRQRRAPNLHKRKSLGGGLTCDFYGYHVASGSTVSVAQHLIDMALSAPGGLDLDSFTFAQNDPNGDKIHEGLRVNSLTISGDADSGVVKLAFDLIGEEEASGTAPSLSATVPHYKSAMFRDCTFALGGSAASLKSFSLTIANNLIVGYNNSVWPSLLVAGPRTVDLQFALYKTANTYDALARATTVTDTTGEIVIKAAHDGSAANDFTTCTIAIDRMNFNSVADAAALNAIWEQTVGYMILKPNTSDNDIDLTWGTA